MISQARVRLAWGFFLLFAAGACSAAGAPPPTSSPAAGQVALSARIEALGRDLERLRRFMGAPKADNLDLGIRSTLPRDLYFQALTLWQKTDRLSFEVMRVHSAPIQSPRGDIGLADALLVLEDAQRILRQVMEELKVPSPPESLLEDHARTEDAFTAILELNRQINLLLERRLGPSDVYMEVTLAIGYAARLLSRYPEANRIPTEPSFEPDKQPGDVYLRLIECLRSITRLFDRLDLPVLRIDTSRTDLDRLRPSDAFLVATMIVSQFDFLHRHLDIARAPPKPTYPGPRFPAHTYQRAGILRAQLDQLERLLTAGRAAPGTTEDGAHALER